ncbi:MAG: DUF58 domain-containing protein [Actinomycetes bacterium]
MTSTPVAHELPTGTVALRFSPTPRLRRLALIAVLAVSAAVISGHGVLAAVAAAPLVLLTVTPRSALPRRARVGVLLTPTRCLEDDELDLTVAVTVAGIDRVELSLHLPDVVEARVADDPDDADAADTVDAVDTVDAAPRDTAARWVLTPRRWGRHSVGPVRMRLVATFGLYAATVDVPLARVTVYPGGGEVARAVAPRELPARLGEHASRALGSGVEFGGVRPFAPGDRRRDVDWRTSARHQSLFVRQYADERACDLALLLDVGADAGEPGRSSLDLTVRAATGLADTYLRIHDRVGVVSLGGWTRWLTPDSSVRQLHRIAELVMDVRDDDNTVAAGLTRVPRAVLKPGTFVCVLSPMLDRRALDAVADLHARGLGLLVIDVLTTEPDVGGRTGLKTLALRLWRLEREGVRVELSRLGVPMIQWDGSGDLSGALLHAMRAVPPGVRA